MKPPTAYAHPERHAYLDATLSDPHHGSILTTLAAYFDLRAGDSVVEVGAGSGRYTEWLLDHGLHVTAVEPDPELMHKLEQRLQGAPHLRLVQSDLAGIREHTSGVRAICGFHVLHHLDAPALMSLAAAITQIGKGAAQFTGWFFLEPNPRNLLYPLQILMTPGMRFAEEAGIWKNDYRSAFRGIANDDCEVGTIGLFPPRAVFTRLPNWLLRRGTALRTGRSLVRLYTIYGHRWSC
jgi:SAM-dependent methyltransferase